MNTNKNADYLTRTSAIFIRLAEAMLRFKWLLVLLVIGFTIFSFTQLKHLRFDNSNEVWFVENDPSLELLDRFHDVFGNDEFVILLFESEDFFEAENIHLLKRLVGSLEEEVPHLREITWLGNVEYIESTEDGISIYELFKTIPKDPNEMAAVKTKALHEESYINSLISGNGQAYTILLEMEKYPEDGETLDPQNEIAPAVRKVLERPEFEGLTPHLAGRPIFNHDFSKLAGRETPKFMVLVLIIQMAILLWLGRGVRGVAVPIIIVFISIIWTMGAIGWMGFTLNMMIIILPSLLICVGIADAIHFISAYHDHQDLGMGRRDSMLKAFSMVGLPCLLTTLTTMGAFLSFLTVSIRPFREFGIYSAFGAVAALILTYILVPFFYSFGMKKKTMNTDIEKQDKKSKRNDLFDRLLTGIHKTVTTRPKQVVGFFLILSLVSLVGALQIKIESNFIQLISPKVPIRQAYDFVDTKMGGSMSMEIMINTGKPDGVKDLQFLKDLEALQNYLDEKEVVTKVTSVLDVMKKMRRALHNNDPRFYAIPDADGAASQYLFLYETSGGDQLDKMVSFDYDITRLTVKMPVMGTGRLSTFIREVEDFSKKTFADSIQVELTGASSGSKVLSDRMSEGIKSSFIAVLIAITIMMIIFMKSIRLGLISMIPNVFPVLITLGLMGFTGITMDMPIMCCSVIIIGVAVDDTIHFFRRYRREFASQKNYSKALQTTLATVGRPLTFTTITLILGFSVMFFSVMKGWSHFGFLAGFAFLWALLADFLFAPALMLLIKPLGPEEVS